MLFFFHLRGFFNFFTKALYIVQTRIMFTICSLLKKYFFFFM